MGTMGRMSLACAVVVFACSMLVGISASAYILGYENVISGNWTAIYPSGGGGSGGTMGSTDSGYIWTPTDNAGGEVSANWDWHTTANPSRSFEYVWFFPYGSATDAEVKLHKGTWNGTSMDWTVVDDFTWSGGQSQFKPTIVQLTTPITNANGLKYEIVESTGVNRRDAVPFIAFKADVNRPVGFVSPTSAVENTTAPYASHFSQALVNKTIDGVSNSADSLINNDGTQRYESITYSFATPQWLSGLMININPVHDPTNFCWKTWAVYDSNDNLLFQSQVGPNGTGLRNEVTDRFQLLAFANGPMYVSSFTMAGNWGITEFPPWHPEANERMGEVWGVTAVVIPEPCTMALLAGGMLFLRRRMAR